MPDKSVIQIVGASDIERSATAFQGVDCSSLLANMHDAYSLKWKRRTGGVPPPKLIEAGRNSWLEDVLGSNKKAHLRHACCAASVSEGGAGGSRTRVQTRNQ